MVCKLSSILKARCRCAGLTLVELLVAIAIGGIATAGLLSLSLYASRSLAGISNYLDLEAQSREALNQLSRDVRSATAVTAISSNKVTLRTPAKATLTYEYFPATRTLERLSGGAWTKILAECDLLQFTLSASPTYGAAYNSFTAASGTNGQVLYVTWNCSRSLPASKQQAESIQSARIVIRNAP